MKGGRETGEKIKGQQEREVTCLLGWGLRSPQTLGLRMLPCFGNFPPSAWLCLPALGSSWYHFYSSNFKVCV